MLIHAYNNITTGLKLMHAALRRAGARIAIKMLFLVYRSFNAFDAFFVSRNASLALRLCTVKGKGGSLAQHEVRALTPGQSFSTAF
jgi:hypothetical protein